MYNGYLSIEHYGNAVAALTSASLLEHAVEARTSLINIVDEHGQRHRAKRNKRYMAFESEGDQGLRYGKSLRRSTGVRKRASSRVLEHWYTHLTGANETHPRGFSCCGGPK